MVSFEVSLNYKNLSDTSHRKPSVQQGVQQHIQNMYILFVIIRKFKFNNN